MRLVRCVQFAIGAVASGGVVAVLSGSALAANGGNLGVTTQTSDVVKQAVTNHSESRTSVANPVFGPIDGQGPQSPADGNADGVTKPTPDSGTSGGDVATATITATSQATANGGVAPGQNSSGPTGSGVGSNTNDSNLPSAQGPSASSHDSSGAGTMMAGGGQASGSLLSPLVSGSSAPEVAVVTSVLPVGGSDQTTAPMTFYRTMLRLQPTITNRLPLIQDLAPTAPSASDPARAPKPAKSNGTLGSLTAQLATVVVPQLASLHGVVADRLVIAINVSVLIGLLLEVFVFSYGLWLRRGGFATAARSDSSANASTPFLLGYVELPPQLRSPFLMAVEMVPNAWRKEEIQ